MNKPLFSTRDGRINLAVWKREGKNGPFLSISITRSQKVGEEYKNFTTFNTSDLPSVYRVTLQGMEFVAKASEGQAEVPVQA